jgi:hypothetical protein
MPVKNFEKKIEMENPRRQQKLGGAKFAFCWLRRLAGTLCVI